MRAGTILCLLFYYSWSNVSKINGFFCKPCKKRKLFRQSAEERYVLLSKT